MVHRAYYVTYITPKDHDPTSPHYTTHKEAFIVPMWAEWDPIGQAAHQQVRFAVLAMRTPNAAHLASCNDCTKWHNLSESKRVVNIHYLEKPVVVSPEAIAEAGRLGAAICDQQAKRRRAKVEYEEIQKRCNSEVERLAKRQRLV